MLHAEVRVKGVIEPVWLDWFADLAVMSASPDETVLVGELPDQAALHGVLNEIEALGLELLEVRRPRTHAAGGRANASTDTDCRTETE